MPRKETIQLRHEQIKGRFDDPLPGADQPQWKTIPGAVVVPRGGSDFDQRGTIILSGFLIKLPAKVYDADGVEFVMADTDEVMVRDELHQIEGPVRDYGKVKLFHTMRAN